MENVPKLSMKEKYQKGMVDNKRENNDKDTKLSEGNKSLDGFQIRVQNAMNQLLHPCYCI